MLADDCSICCDYPAIRSIGRDTKFTGTSFFLYTVTDFSARFLTIRVKFCVEVPPHLGQLFSYFRGIAPRTAKFLASTGVISRDMLLAEALLVVIIVAFTVKASEVVQRDIVFDGICMCVSVPV